jgi:hypothetical protein
VEFELNKHTATFFNLFPDILVIYKPLCSTLDAVSSRGVLWQAAEALFLLDIPDVAKYLVKDGREITIDPAPGASDSDLEHYLNMLPLAAFLYQRGMLVFHAAAVANDQGVILLAGDSGSGKSSLLMALYQRGWRVLADDLAIIGLDGQGHPFILSTSQEIILWPATLNKFGISSATLPSVDANRFKFKIINQVNSGSQQVRFMYKLEVNSKGSVEFEEIMGINRFQAIMRCLYNSHVADALFNRLDYLRSAATIAQSLPIGRLKRPRGVWSVDELADLIESQN